MSNEGLASVIAEMRRNPDAQYLLEWIECHTAVSTADAAADVNEAVNAYFDAIEEL